MDEEREYTLKEWCAKLPEHHLVSKQLSALQKEPRLGCATTGQLLAELRARAKIDGSIDYRTVDGS